MSSAVALAAAAGFAQVMALSLMAIVNLWLGEQEVLPPMIMK